MDGIGGFDSYGVLENTDQAATDGLLPMGISGGCTLLRDVPKDQAITLADVTIPGDRLIDRLWKEQNEMFGVKYAGVSY